MNCARCGSPLREGATFCTNCGLPTMPPQVGAPDAPSTLSFDPTIRSSGASGPAPAGSSGGAYDPTVMARPSAPSMYPAGSGQMPGASGPALVPASVPMDAPTVASSSPGSVPYGYPPAAGPGSVPYGYPPAADPGSLPYASTVYGAPSQPFPPAPPPEFLVPPPPPAPPLTLRLFGADADALGARPHTRTQAWLLRNIPLNYVVSKWFMAIGGAVIALAVGLLLTLLVQALLGTSIPDAFGIPKTEDPIRAAQFNPPFLNFFAWEHQVTLTLHFSSNSQTGDDTFILPIVGLLLVPALALTLGGFLAAASDFQRHPRYAIARGALIGPFYAIVLLLLSFLSSSTLNNSSQSFSSGGTYTLSPSVLQECLFGLLWGTLFGALGGWIQLTGRRFVTAALPSLQTLRRARVAGALTGAGVALVCGILLFVGFEFAYIAYAAANAAGGGSQQVSNYIPPNTTSNLWTTLRLVLSLGPGVAIWLFALGTGAPITMAATEPGNSSLNSSFGFIGAMHSPGNNYIVYLFALGPAISYFVGGRIAARTARAQRTSDAFTAGALIALPLSVLLGLAALLVPFGENVTASGSGSQSIMISEGPAFGGTFLAVLIAGAIVGGIGGASAVGAPKLGSLPRLLLIPLRPIGFPLSRLLDGLTGRARGEQRSEAILWFYDSVLLTVILAVILLVAIPVAPALGSSSLPFSVVRGIIVWVATLLVGLPLLFLIGSLVTAFSSPPVPPAVQAATGPGPQTLAALAAMPGSSPIIAPPSQPFPPGAPVYGTGPLPGGLPSAPGSQPFAPPSQPFPPGVYAPPGSQTFPPGGYTPPGSQPFPPAGMAPGDATITSADTPTVRSSQPYPPGPPAGNNGEPPAMQ